MKKMLMFFKRRYIIILMILFILYVIFEPKFGAISLIKLHFEHRYYKEKLWQTKARIILLQNKIHLLKTDKDFIETHIREEKGMIKKGERIILIDK